MDARIRSFQAGFGRCRLGRYAGNAPKNAKSRHTRRLLVHSRPFGRRVRVGVTGLVTRALPTGSQLGCPMGIRECRRCKEHTGGDASRAPAEPRTESTPKPGSRHSGVGRRVVTTRRTSANYSTRRGSNRHKSSTSQHRMLGSQSRCSLRRCRQRTTSRRRWDRVSPRMRGRRW